MIDFPAFRTCPCVPSALWLIAGIILPVLPATTSISWAATLLTVVGIGTVAFLWTPDESRFLCLFLPAGIILAITHLYILPSTCIIEHEKKSRVIDIKAVVVDSAYSADELEWLAVSKGYEIQVRAVRTHPDGDWQSCSGKVILRLPQEKNLEYGTRIQAAGYFDAPSPPLVTGEFNYRRFLRARSIQSVFHAQNISRTGEAQGWRRLMRGLYRFREKCAARLTPPDAPPESSSLLLAMTLGYRDGIDHRIRRTFVQSGIVHIFAISGLHVGIIAGFILFTCKLGRIPYRYRYFLLPLILGGYVLMVGAGPSAVRAWIMISLWAGAKGLMIPLLPLNAVAAAAILILLFKPLQIIDLGFQFSFVIVTILVVGWRHGQEAVNSLGEKELWIPSRARSLRQRLASQGIKYTAALFAGSLLAWLAGAGIILATQGLFIPGAVLFNLFVAFLAWLAIFFSILKIGLGLILPWLPLADACGFILERGMTLLRWLAAIASDPPFSFAMVRPWLPLVVLYYALLLAALSGLQGKLNGWKRWAPGILAPLMLVAAAQSREAAQKPTIAVFWGDGTKTPVLAIDSACRLPPVIVNTGDYWTGQRVGTWIRSRGWNEVETVFLTNTRWEQAAGLSNLLEKTQPKTLVLSENWDQKQYLQKPVATVQKYSGRLRPFSSPLPQHQSTTIFRQPALEVSLQSYNAGERMNLQRRTIKGKIEVEYLYSPSKGADIKFTDPAGNEKQINTTFSREPRWQEKKIGFD